jgi:hypothetical protein
MVVLDKNEVLKKAFLAYEPLIKEDYLKQIRSTFSRMVKEFGPTLKGISKDKYWYQIYGNLLGVTEREGQIDYSRCDEDTRPWKINEKSLDKNADNYAHSTALQWYGKMIEKLGNLDDVKVSDPRSFNVIITGRHNDNQVEIKQKIIVNVSKLGTPFNQFPAHIYVDNKFQSEAQYKKTVQGWGIEIASSKPKSRTKCLSCGYSGETSTFPINYRWAIDKRECPKCHSRNLQKEAKTEGVPQIDLDVNLHPKKWHFGFSWLGRPSSDSVSGNTQEEAIAKILKYREEATDFKLERVYDWHDRLIWDSKEGTPPPGPSTKLAGEDVLAQAVGQKKKYEYAYSYIANGKDRKTTMGMMAKTQEEADLLIAEYVKHYSQRPDIYSEVTPPDLVAIYYKGKSVWRKPKKGAKEAVVIGETPIWEDKDKPHNSQSSSKRLVDCRDTGPKGIGGLR